MHHKTVAAVCAAYPEAIHEEQQKRVNRLRSAADKLVDLVDDNPESVPANVRCLAASQLLDKAQLLDGCATSRIEKVERIDIYSDWEEVIQKHLEAGKVREIGESSDISFVNASAEMGFDGEKKSSISDSPATPIAALPGPGDDD